MHPRADILARPPITGGRDTDATDEPENPPSARGFACLIRMVFKSPKLPTMEWQEADAANRPEDAPNFS